MKAEKGPPPSKEGRPIAINEEQHMRIIGLAALFLLASAFGALAADTGAQGTGTAPRAHKTMQHKTMHTGTVRRHKAVYRHGRYRTGYYMGGRYYAYGRAHRGGYAYIHGHRRVYGSRYHRGHVTAMHRGYRRGHVTAMHRGTAMRQTGRRATMHHRAGTAGTRKACENARKGHAEQGQDFYILSCGYARLVRLDPLLRASPLLDNRARRRQ